MTFGTLFAIIFIFVTIIAAVLWFFYKITKEMN